MTTPTTADTSPTIRSWPSGMSRAASMARFVADGNAANSIPSMTNNTPIAATKSDIGAVKPTAANYFAPDGVGAA